MEREPDQPHDPLKPPGSEGRPDDPGGYIGHEPELARDTIPGGVQPGDVRVAGVATQPEPPGARGATAQDAWPEGHREGGGGSDIRREAGENR